jgi:hypothetical protein
MQLSIQAALLNVRNLDRSVELPRTACNRITRNACRAPRLWCGQ